MKTIPRAKILDKQWQIRPCRMRDNRGECDHPEKPGKEIRIDPDLRGEELLEVVFHEHLHAGNWSLDEEFVGQISADCARNITRLGYKLVRIDE